MNVIDKETRREWLQHPCTQELLCKIVKEKECHTGNALSELSNLPLKAARSAGRVDAAVYFENCVRGLA